MEFFSNLFATQSNLGTFPQIVLDVVILALLALIILAVRKRKGSGKDAALVESFEKIIEATAAISKEFEANLAKRQELIQQITARLDRQIRESQDLCLRLEQAGRDASSAHSAAAFPAKTTHPEKIDRQKVLALANKGLSAQEIAKNMKKPVGEIELILNLLRIAT